MLRAVRGVEHDGTAQSFHALDGGHVVDQAVVSEERSALGQQDAVVLAAADLLDHVAHLVGREELALLDVDGLARLGAGAEQVGLATEKGGHLDAVDHGADGRRLARLVDIGHDGQTGLGANLLEDAQSLVQTGSAKAGDAAAIGLVETRFEQNADTGVLGDPDQAFGDLQAAFKALDDTRAGHDEQRFVETNADLIDVEFHPSIPGLELMLTPMISMNAPCRKITPSAERACDPAADACRSGAGGHHALDGSGEHFDMNGQRRSRIAIDLGAYSADR